MKRTPMKRSAIRSKVAPVAIVKLKTCKACRKRFAPTRAAALVCSQECAIVYAPMLAAKLERAKANAVRADDKDRRMKLKSPSKFKADLQVAVNALVRWRDRFDGCISCDRPATWGGQWHASHYKSVGSHPALRFDMANIHKACSICNKWKAGNIGDYTPRVLAKIGQEEFDRINGPQPEKHFSAWDLLEMTRAARAELRRLKKLHDT